MKFIPRIFSNISCFQLKNSNIKSIEENIIIPIYPRSDFRWIYIEPIYKTQKRIKYNTEYTIARGNTGTGYGTGVNGGL
ncbi:hypothetical protein N8455_00705 [Candidatus Gracilibacteria bacterium]|nr:hypothetical protein [Candidatus Gracilibacteria bacterium]